MSSIIGGKHGESVCEVFADIKLLDCRLGVISNVAPVADTVDDQLAVGSGDGTCNKI